VLVPSDEKSIEGAHVAGIVIAEAPPRAVAPLFRRLASTARRCRFCQDYLDRGAGSRV